MANKKYFLSIGADGRDTEIEAPAASTGVANAGDIPALDSTGRLDPSFMPIGVGPDVANLETTENLTPGKYVNIFNSGGTPKVRLADNSNDRPAHGFVKDTVLTGANVNVFFEGPNLNVTGRTPGARQFLGTAGAPTETRPTAPSALIVQFLGIAVSTTAINTDIDDEKVLDQ